MTLTEFSQRYNIPQAVVQSLFEKINVSPDVKIDAELEGILLNLSDTRVPTYPATRLSALSPAEISVLLKYYDLHIHWEVFLSEGFYPFGKMLFSLLQQEKRSISIPATVIVELGKRAKAEPDNPQLGALKALLVQMNKSGCGIVSHVKEDADVSFAEAVYCRCPGKNLAIVSPNSAVPASILREAEQSGVFFASFYLDTRGLLRVNQEVLLPPRSRPVTSDNLLQRKNPDTTSSVALPTPPDNGVPLLQHPIQPLPPIPPQHERQTYTTPKPGQPIPNHTSQPLQSAYAAPSEPVFQAHPSTKPGFSSASSFASPLARSHTVPADVTALTPGAVPYPFPGPDAQPTRPPVRMNNQAEPPQSRPAPAYPAVPAMSSFAPPAPAATPAMPSVTPPSFSDAEESAPARKRVVKHARLRKAGYKEQATAPSAAPAFDDSPGTDTESLPGYDDKASISVPTVAHDGAPIGSSAAVQTGTPDKPIDMPSAQTSPVPETAPLEHAGFPRVDMNETVPSGNAWRPENAAEPINSATPEDTPETYDHVMSPSDDLPSATMKDKYVQGLDEALQTNDKTWDHQEDRFSPALRILKTLLFLLSLGIVGLLAYLLLTNGGIL